MEIICSKFYLNCLKNVENTGNISFLSLSKVCLSVCQFLLNMLHELFLVRTSNTKFHENLTTSIGADTMLETDRWTDRHSIVADTMLETDRQTDRQAWSPYKVLLLLDKGYLKVMCIQYESYFCVL